MNLSLDTSTWKRMSFGDVISNVTERVDNPSEAGVDRYVGLEHLDSGVMTVQHWDSPEKVAAQKLRFQSGDVIFGRRRAYQKKVAKAEFEGICSAHALVLRARTDYIHPEYLPVFLSSDYFLDRAIGISVGSLSPTVNWRDLKIQEFEFPPLHEQERIADLLWALETNRAQVADEREVSFAVRQAWLDREIGEMLNQQAIPFEKVWSRSPESGRSSQPVDEPTGRFVLSLAALGPEGYRRGYLKNIPDSSEAQAASLRHGDLLISRANTIEAVGRVGIYSEDRDDVSFPDTMMRLSLDESVLPEFAVAAISSSHGRFHMRRTAAGSATSMVKINRKSLGRFAFPNVELSKQTNLLATLRRLDHAVRCLDAEAADLTTLRSSLLADIFGGN